MEIIYLHCTRNWTRLLIEGGTPFDATHKYAAMCRRLTFVISSISPSTTFTVRNTQNYLRYVYVWEARASESRHRQTKLSSSPSPFPTQLYKDYIYIWQCVGKIIVALHCYSMVVRTLLGAINWMTCRIVTIFTSNGHFVAILPSPHHIGLRISFCLTH